MNNERESVILVGFFDVVMFRHVDAGQVVDRWATLLGKKFRSLADISVDDLVDARIASRVICLKGCAEVGYRRWMSVYYQLLVQRCPDLGGEISEDNFATVVHDLECAVEYGVQYPNIRLLKHLAEETRKGKRICIIEDYHLGKEDLLSFMQAKNVDTGIFSGIFVSCDHDARTEDGALYAVALDDLGVCGKNVVMMGDDADSSAMAGRNGIHGRIMRHGGHRLRRRPCRVFENDAFRHIRQDCYRYNSPFVEYAVILYTFIRKLNDELEQRSTRHVVFLAREGWFLRQLFEGYRWLLCSEPGAIRTAYLRCSRAAIFSLQPEKATENILGDISLRNYLRVLGFFDEDVNALQQKYAFSPEQMETAGSLSANTGYLKLMSDDSFRIRHATRLDENRQAFLAYARELTAGEEPLDIVDIGWVGRMQQGIEEVLGVRTRGWYLGIRGVSEDPHPYERHGLIFAADGDHVSPYFDILCANTQLYEQLLAAPHGAAEGYVFSDGRPGVREAWADSEKFLYQDLIEKTQGEMRAIFSGLVAWCDKEDVATMVRWCAHTVLRSSLIADSRRLAFLRRLDKSFVNNFGQVNQGLRLNRQHVRLGIAIIAKPEHYVRYAAKFQRTLRDGSIQMWLYYPFAWMFYAYVNLITTLRRGRSPA